MWFVNVFISLCLNLAPWQTLPAQVRPVIISASIEGVWLLHGTDRSVKFVFMRDRTFTFSGVGAASTGTWSVDREGIRLVWMTIDRQRVRPGSVRYSYPITPNGVLTVGGYDYRRSPVTSQRR